MSQKFLTTEESDKLLGEYLLRLVYDKVSDLDSDRIIKVVLTDFDEVCVYYRDNKGYNKVKYFSITTK